MHDDVVRVVFPQTEKRPVSDVYHDVTVVDDYRWLEDFDNPEVRAWNDEQNSFARAFLDAIPMRGPIHERLQELYTSSSPDHIALRYRGRTLFAIKWQPPKQQPFLITLPSTDDPESARVVLDPNELDPEGTTTIDFYEPSLDGRLVAVSLSQHGSEIGTLHIYEVATGRELGDLIPRVTYPTGGGSVAWNAEATGFWYTRYPRDGERPVEDLAFYQKVYFHRLGTSAEEDTYVLGQDFPRIAEIELDSSHDGRYLLATVANGDGGEFEHYLRDPAGTWTQLTHWEDQVVGAELGGDDLYLLSRKDAPRGRLLRVPLTTPQLAHAEIVVEESDAVIERCTPAGSYLYVVDLVGGPTQLRVFDRVRHEHALVPIKPISTVLQVVPLDDDEILFRNVSFVDAPAWYRFSPGEEEPERTALFVVPAADFDDCEVVRAVASSKDGTRVPLSIIRRKGVEGANPTILYGYGGYSVSLSPSFAIRRRLWLDQGGVYAIANLRGGGEFGEKWHKGGNLLNKQNVFDDFSACAQYLIDASYTSPAQLAIEGGSNGGLLMGAALTQQPELFRAVLSYVGIYDMLRVERDPNGAFNVTEFGETNDRAQFDALYAYSPYHHVVDGTPYPAVLFVTGDHDGRVNPAHSRKMTARLQAATASGRPIVLRTSATSGHGIGTSLADRIAEDADAFAFVFELLGLKEVR